MCVDKECGSLTNDAAQKLLFSSCLNLEMSFSKPYLHTRPSLRRTVTIFLKYVISTLKQLNAKTRIVFSCYHDGFLKIWKNNVTCRFSISPTLSRFNTLRGIALHWCVIILEMCLELHRFWVCISTVPFTYLLRPTYFRFL